MTERILLVDDDRDTLRLVGVMLERQGYQIIAANSGQQALLLAEKEQPDLILLDVMMPEMDGFEVTRRIRANPVTTKIPVIMFSAKGQVDDKVTGFEAGADDYLTKPAQPRELIAHLKAVLARSKASKGTQAPAQAEATDRGTVMAIMAARGGLGVTTIALNLGISIHQLFSKEVIIADLRPGQGSIGGELGYLNAEGLSNLMQRKTSEITRSEVERELISYLPGVRLLLSSLRPLNSKYSLNKEHFERIVEFLANLTSFLVLDLGNNLSPFSGKIINLVDELMIVIEPSPISLNQTRILVEDLATLGVGEGRIKYVMVNKLRSSVQLSVSQVEEQIGRPIAMTITPAPELAFHASNNQRPMVLLQPESMTADQFRQLAKKVAEPYLKAE
jgi:CheY-like chemotaxis protein/MinD-like ATPase involved in chromosome partitioning or flagellar assembly